MRKNLIMLFVTLLVATLSNAQTEKNVDHQSLIWTRYYNQLKVNDKWSIHTEFDNRVFINPNVQNLFVFRTQARYKLNKQVEFGAGIAYFNVATQDPNVDLGFHVPEYRGQQDVTLVQQFGKLNLTHRYQIEERFFQNFTNQGLEDGTTFFLRFRYRIQGDMDVWKKGNKFWKAILYDEIMINGGNKIIKNTFDQNRLYFGIQHGICPALSVELGYLNSYQQRASGVDYYNRDIIRFSIYHKLKLKKKNNINSK
jgi:Protein of unknown function (DUF2490)